MTIFELLILKCLTLSTLGGSYSKTCDWSPSGDLYTTAEVCQFEAKRQVGKTIMGDAIYVGGDGRISSGTIIEDSRCAERFVLAGSGGPK